jgi:hypothetical protein
VPPLRPRARSGGTPIGGVVGYPLDRVYREVAILGSVAHWTLTELLDLDHLERRRWVSEISEVTLGRELR